MYMSRSLGVSIFRSRSKDLDHQVLVSRSRCLGQVYVSRFTSLGLHMWVYVYRSMSLSLGIGSKSDLVGWGTVSPG